MTVNISLASCGGGITKTHGFLDAKEKNKIKLNDHLQVRMNFPFYKEQVN